MTRTERPGAVGPSTWEILLFCVRTGTLPRRCAFGCFCSVVERMRSRNPERFRQEPPAAGRGSRQVVAMPDYPPTRPRR
jgi:hypothetical protein